MITTKTPLVRVRGLTRHFGTIVAVDRLDLDLPAGGVIGLVGPNGSGKSTTIRMLLGLIEPTAGEGTILGEPIGHPERYADRVGALVEGPAFIPNISARANLESMALLRGVAGDRIDLVLDTVGLTERAADNVAAFSLGMKQRLAIAIALLPDPDLLVLDEPTNGLDPAGIVEMRELFRRLAGQGRTVLVSSHLLSEIQTAADYLVIIRSGKLLFAGALAGLLREEQRFVDIEPADETHVDRLAERLRSDGLEVEREGSALRVHCDPARSPDLHRAAVALGIDLRRLVPRSETLEDVFLRMINEAPSAPDLRSPE